MDLNLKKNKREKGQGRGETATSKDNCHQILSLIHALEGAEVILCEQPIHWGHFHYRLSNTSVCHFSVTCSQLLSSASVSSAAAL